MPNKEIFPYPTVKQVIFQIHFPNLFFIESKIGDLQVEIMKEFPQSSLILRKPLALIALGQQNKIENLPPEDEQVQKIWQFKSEKNYKLNVLSNSLDISSEFHKTYNNPKSDNKFRDVINYVLENFIKVIKIPIINRIGLRYIDECPIIAKENDNFLNYYNSTFPLQRFNLESADEMIFKTTVKRDNNYLTYKESIQKVDDQYKLILDFDGYSKNIEVSNYLKTADCLHDLISDEYFRTVKEPLLNIMRTGKGE